jgi:hypothetical protein
MKSQTENANDEFDQSANRIRELQALHVGQFDRVPARVRVGSEMRSVTLSGEIVAQGHLADGHFVVERWQRLALKGRSADEELTDGRFAPGMLGTLSLVGPFYKDSQPVDDESLAVMPLLLHYEALSTERTPYSTRREPDSDMVDAVFPEVETIALKLDWSIGDTTPSAVYLSLGLSVDRLVEEKLGLIQEMTIDPFPVTLQPYGSETYQPKQHHSLTPNCPPPNGGGPLMIPTCRRVLPLKFINLCAVPALLDVEQVCQAQIAGVCEVWRNKAALDIDAVAQLFDGTSSEKDEFSVLSADQEYDLRLLSYSSTAQIEVYVIDEFIVDHGGGIAYDAGTAGAFCILQYNLAQGNPYLLAHELGHVLGLDHPLGQQANLLRGSPASIMEVGHPNPSRLTRHECDVLEAQRGTLPHNPKVITTTVADFFHPDP